MQNYQSNLTANDKIRQTKNLPYHKHTGADSAKIGVGAANTATTHFINLTPNAGETVVLDVSLYCIFRIQMPAGNVTLSAVNGNEADIFMVEITQDSVGGRSVTWFSGIKWPGGTTPTLSATANKKDTFGFEVESLGVFDGYVIGKNL